MRIGQSTNKYTDMEPEAFLRTIYLGDRACKGLILDSWEKRLKIVVDVISRVRDPSGEWNFYSAEDIEDGYLVLDGLRELRLDPAGCLPNDYINSITVRRLAENTEPLFEFTISISSVDDRGQSREVLMAVVASSIYIEDPRNPGVRVD